MAHDTPGTKPRVLITSYGILHGAPPAPRHRAMPVEIDLADALRNPHDDPGMRYKTGLDPDVFEHVMATPGASDYRDQAVHEILERIAGGATTVEVHSYCRGGRHRSVALAEAIKTALAERGIDTTHDPRDVHKPVVQAVPASMKRA